MNIEGRENGRPGELRCRLAGVRDFNLILSTWQRARSLDWYVISRR